MRRRGAWAGFDVPRAFLTVLAVLAAVCAGCEPRPEPTLLEGVSFAPRGHQELRLRDNAPPLPCVLRREGPVGVCLTVPATTDTSQWEAHLWFDPGTPSTSSSAFRPPTTRMGTTVCFDVPLPDVAASGRLPEEVRLCGEIRDRYDATTARLPCATFAQRDEASAYDGLLGSMRATLGRREKSRTADLVAELDAIGGRARAQGFPLLELRLRLVSVYFLRRAGTSESIREARDRLERMPPWLDTPAAASWAAQVAYERATLALAVGTDLEGAWMDLRHAEASDRRIADPKLVTVIMKQSEVLARVGAVEEARERLRLAIAGCGETPCEPSLVPSAENTLAWLMLQDPDAGDASLGTAEELLTKARAAASRATDPLEAANVAINLAYAQARRRRDPRPALRDARHLIDAAGPGDAARARWLSDWSLEVEGESALALGKSHEALGLCGRAARDSEMPVLTARAMSCTSRALEANGDLERAADAIERALFLHERSSPLRLGQSIALGPGQRADDFYRAARLAAERGRPDEAWEILRRLDALDARTSACADCPALDEERQRQADALLLQIAALERPASGERRAQSEEIRRSLMESLRDMTRTVSGSSEEAAAMPSDEAVRFRAFPLEDEILLLERAREGRVRLYRRTRIAPGSARPHEPDRARRRGARSPRRGGLGPSRRSSLRGARSGRDRAR